MLGSSRNNPSSHVISAGAEWTAADLDIALSPDCRKILITGPCGLSRVLSVETALDVMRRMTEKLADIRRLKK